MNATRPSTWSSSPLALFALIAVAIAAGAQYLRTFEQANRTAMVLFAAAVGGWLGILIVSRTVLTTRIDETCSPPQEGRRPSLGFALAGLLMVTVTYATCSDNSFTLDNVPPWILSVIVLLYAFWDPEKTWPQWQTAIRECVAGLAGGARQGLCLSPRLLLLGLVLGIGVVSYFRDLDAVPGEMDSDHAEKILDVNDIVTNGLRPIFFERNTGREPLEFYLIALLVEVGRHPIDHMALKLVTAAMGFLVIPGTFVLARELFDDTVAYLAAALVAVAKWPMTIARMGLRFPLTPVLMAPLLYFLIRALKHGRRNDFLLAGVFLGAGLYGYNAFRIAPVLILALLALWPFLNRRLDRRGLAQYVGNSLLMFLMAGAVLMPLVRYSVDRPGAVWYRVLTRLASEEREVTEDPVQVFARNELNVAQMFNWTGDDAWPNSIPGDPALDFVSGGLFLFGVVYALYRSLRYRERAGLVVLVALAILLLPSSLAIAFPNENPSNARAGGAIPIVFILAALPLAWLWRAFAEAGRRRAAVGVVLVLLVGIGVANYVRYFRDFYTSYLRQSWNSGEVALVVRSFATSVGDYDHAYLMLYPHWIDTRNVGIHMGRIGWEQTLPDGDAARDRAGDAANKLFVLSVNDAANLARLQEIMPNGQLRRYIARMPGKDFVLWYVPGTIAPDAPLSYPNGGTQK